MPRTGLRPKGVRTGLSMCLVLGWAVGGVAMGEVVEAEREFRYRGRETLEVRMVGGVPPGTKREGVEVQVAGVMVRGSDLLYSFGIVSDDRPVGVVVENVTAATAIRLVEQFPAEGVELAEDGRWTWFAQGGGTTMEPRTVPWILEEGDTNFVFRIFVETEGGRRVEIYQPAVFGETFKREARRRVTMGAGELGESEEPKKPLDEGEG